MKQTHSHFLNSHTLKIAGFSLMIFTLANLSLTAEARPASDSRNTRNHIQVIQNKSEGPVLEMPIIGDVTHAGTGCPSAMPIDVYLSEQDQTLAIFPNQMSIEVPANSYLKRKACSIAIPLSVPAGKALRLSNIRSTGSFGLDLAGSTLNIKSEVFFAGSEGPTLEILKTNEDGYGVFDEVNLVDSIQSSCGHDVTLRLNSSILATKAYSQGDLNFIAAQFEVIDCQ